MCIRDSLIRAVICLAVCGIRYRDFSIFSSQSHIHDFSVRIQPVSYTHLDVYKRQSGVSHDIRTPLSMVMGYAGQIEDNESLPESERKKARIIRFLLYTSAGRIMS